MNNGKLSKIFITASCMLQNEVNVLRINKLVTNQYKISYKYCINVQHTMSEIKGLENQATLNVMNFHCVMNITMK